MFCVSVELNCLKGRKRPMSTQMERKTMLVRIRPSTCRTRSHGHRYSDATTLELFIKRNPSPRRIPAFFFLLPVSIRCYISRSASVNHEQVRNPCYHLPVRFFFPLYRSFLLPSWIVICLLFLRFFESAIMSDEEHHFESKADAGASKTYPQQAGTIRKNGYIVIKGRPCKVSCSFRRLNQLLFLSYLDFWIC